MKHIITLEFWKDIPGYEGLYQVSNFGRIKSLKRTTCHERILKQQEHPTKHYMRVCLCKNNQKKNFLVHRLVAEVFLPNPEEYDTVDHLNFDPTDNRVCNLRWLDRNTNNHRRRGEYK